MRDGEELRARRLGRSAPVDPRVPAIRIAAGRLDLDHIRSHIGEEPTRQRPLDSNRKLNHAQSFERFHAGPPRRGEDMGFGASGSGSFTCS